MNSENVNNVNDINKSKINVNVSNSVSCYLCGKDKCTHIKEHKCGYCWGVISGEHFDFCPTIKTNSITDQPRNNFPIKKEDVSCCIS